MHILYSFFFKSNLIFFNSFSIYLQNFFNFLRIENVLEFLISYLIF